MIVEHEVERSFRYLFTSKRNYCASKFIMNRPNAAVTSTTSQQATLTKFLTTTKTKSSLSGANDKLDAMSTSTIDSTRKRRAPDDFEFVQTRTTTTTADIHSDSEVVSEEDTTVQKAGSVAKPSAGLIKWKVLSESVLFGLHSYHRQPSFRTISNQSTPNNTSHRVAVAGFDLDGTLIVTKTGYSFARNENDWKFKFGEARTLNKIKSWLDESTECLNERILVIFSNQSGIALSPKVAKSKKARKHVDETKTRLWQFKTKLAAIMKLLGLRCYVIAATGKDEFRKPHVGMWRLVKEVHERHLRRLQKKGSEFVDEHIDVDLDRDNSFFVGDAAGRKGDHSTGDKDFAKNLGIKFYTPEEFFGG
ncbi:polynucleotide kinase 3 phosphatase-domain-containing protein [Lipomyces doorenjongii]|uniref:polynucleotide kinase 3 phosphatase-domain-containing protein n=1 Tax=Lipomyces doorenjongii TaxID=383834 RepID=UPI0034CECE47